MSNEPGNLYFRSLFHDNQHGDITGTSVPVSVAGSSPDYSPQQFDPSQMSYTDCLHGFMDYNSLEKAFGMSPSSSEVFSSIEGNQKQVISPGELCGGSENNMGTTPNSSISSSSTEAGAEEDSGKSKKDLQPKGSEDGGDSSKKM